MNEKTRQFDVVVDDIFKQVSERLAQRVSRRSFLERLGRFLILPAAGALPLLPVNRAVAAPTVGPCTNCGCPSGTNNDPTSCQYWKYVGISGYPCINCGGGDSSCPSGSTPGGCWSQTVRDCAGRNHLIYYKDCCKTLPRLTGSGNCRKCGGGDGESTPWCGSDLSGRNACAPTGITQRGVDCTMAIDAGVVS